MSALSGALGESLSVGCVPIHQPLCMDN
ncbi:hypothetical protein HU200_005783 [Digitaria exilis]|uniref:Uncharacterized protein n=1 Tax=Digitaria exilis TaxID=1010633 RepID=A0A835FQY9_9POAL|nr:hypothetical protein HU200_011279 [Digitaria exilis]KAF8772381.1 hypothetical protein HU200_005783 [Digitaria exilis]